MEKRKQHNATMDFYSNVLQDDIKSSAYEKLFVIDRLQHKCVDDIEKPLEESRLPEMPKKWVGGEW